jgi:hypothetical protein
MDKKCRPFKAANDLATVELNRLVTVKEDREAFVTATEVIGFVVVVVVSDTVMLVTRFSEEKFDRTRPENIMWREMLLKIEIEMTFGVFSEEERNTIVVRQQIDWRRRKHKNCSQLEIAIDPESNIQRRAQHTVIFTV